MKILEIEQQIKTELLLGGKSERSMDVYQIIAQTLHHQVWRTFDVKVTNHIEKKIYEES